MARRTVDEESGPLPVFVQGVGHSGTTILYRMLALHPDAGWFSQYSLRDGSIPGRVRFPFATTLDRQARRLAKPHWEKSEGRMPGPLTPHPGEAHAIFDYLFPPGGEAADSANRARSHFARFGAQLDRRLIISKLPRLATELPALRSAFPNVRHVHIIRDGTAVSLSMLEKFMRDGTPRAIGLRSAAELWVGTIAILKDEREQHSNVFDTRYEDLCVDVHATVASILDFLSLDARVYPWSRIPRTLRSTNQRWHRAASLADLGILNEVLEPVYSALGYRSADQAWI